MSKKTDQPDQPDRPDDTPIRESDEPPAMASSDAAAVMDALDRHRVKILAGIVAVALAVCLALVMNQVKKQQHLEAASAYSSALENGTIAALDEVVVNHPDSIAAGDALLSKADLQIDQSKLEDAQATLERFTSDFTEHPRHSQGVFALGNLNHLAGDLEAAGTFYQRTIDEQPDGELTPLARIRLGDIALAAGNEDEAEQHYQDAFTLHPGTPFFTIAQTKLALLEVGDPPVVPRPEPESESESKSGTGSKSTPKPESDSKSAPDSVSETDRTPDPDSDPKSQAKPDSKQEPDPAANSKDSTPQSKSKQDSPPQSKPKQEQGPQPDSADSEPAPPGPPPSSSDAETPAGDDSSASQQSPSTSKQTDAPPPPANESGGE